MITYKEIGFETIERINEDGTLSYIPMSEENSDYKQYLASIEATQPEEE
jgi:hypothetical protein